MLEGSTWYLWHAALLLGIGEGNANLLEQKPGVT